MTESHGASPTVWFLFLNRPEAFLRGRLPRLESLLQMIESFLFLMEKIFGEQQCVLYSRGDAGPLSVRSPFSTEAAVWLGRNQRKLSRFFLRPPVYLSMLAKMLPSAKQKTDEVPTLTPLGDWSGERKWEKSSDGEQWL